MEVNKEELRRLAEKCVPEAEWFKAGHLDHSNIDSSAARFIAAANPAAILSLLDENAQLRAENERLRKDAERYGFLRNQHWPVARLAVVVNPKISVKLGHYCPSGERLDHQIDLEIAREGNSYP